MAPFWWVIIGLAFELLQTDKDKILHVCSDIISAYKDSWTPCYTKILVTVIKFLVRVPVLSEQILSAPPIVSQACKYLTKLFYSFILPTE